MLFAGTSTSLPSTTCCDKGSSKRKHERRPEVATTIGKGSNGSREQSQDGIGERSCFQASQSAQGLQRIFRSTRFEQFLSGLPSSPRHSILHPCLSTLANLSENYLLLCNFVLSTIFSPNFSNVYFTRILHSLFENEISRNFFQTNQKRKIKQKSLRTIFRWISKFVHRKEAKEPYE